MDKTRIILILLLIVGIVSLLFDKKISDNTKLLNILILLIVVLVVLVPLPHFKKNKFSQLSDNCTTGISPGSTIPEGSVAIFYAPWCGHCKMSMSEFKDACARGDGKVLLINSDLPENKEIVSKYKINGFPTIMNSRGQTHRGSRTADSILEFLNK